MKHFVFAVLGLLAIAAMPGNVDAGGRCKQRAAVGVNQHQQFAVTAFAVPIGIPVASPAYMAYQGVGAYGDSTIGYNYTSRQRTVFRGRQEAQGMAAGCSSCQCQKKGVSSSALSEKEKLVATLKAQIAALESGDAVAATSPQSNVVAHCASCHDGSGTKAGTMTDFRAPESLSCEQRLAAIRLILSDDPATRMPKGQTLPPEQIGLLIQELARPGVPAGSTSSPEASQP